MKTIGKIGFLVLFTLIFSIFNTFGQGTPGVPGADCASAGGFCSENPDLTFEAGVDTPPFQSGTGCLSSTPNPAWYKMQVSQNGRINISLKTTPPQDLDFACWGPFNDEFSGCGQLLMNCNGCSSHGPTNGPNPSNLGGYPVGNLVDCSFSALDSEYVHIPNATSGQWYMLLITNYSNQPCNITLNSDPSSTGSTNCAIMTPPAISDTVCLGETATLTVSTPVAGANYIWEGPYDFYRSTNSPSIPINTGDVNIFNINNNGDTVYLSSGTYTFSLTINSNGQLGNTVECALIVNNKPTITATTDSICIGENATLTASGGNSFIWNTNETTPSITVSPTVTTEYSVAGTSVWGCKDSAQTQVVVFNNPNITVTPPAVCSGELSTVSAPNAVSFVWNDGDSTMTDTIRPIVTSQQIYTVTVTMNGGCSGTATLTANPNPIIEATATEICQGESSTVSVTDLSGSTSNTYTWSNGSSGATISVSPYNNMDISVIGTTQFGCVGYDTTTVIVHPRPTSDFLPSSYMVTIDEGDVTFNDMSTNATSWYYNFGEFHNPSNISTEQNPTHTFISTGFFKVWQVVTTEFGCADSSYKRIQVEAPYFFYVPSAFTPDNDGKNEEFCPKGKGIDSRNYTMEIYDRWGTLIFKTNTPLACWDGTYNGEKAAMGSYIYKINLKDMESKYHEYLGTFVILK